jgi:hypothetical protein
MNGSSSSSDQAIHSNRLSQKVLDRQRPTGGSSTHECESGQHPERKSGAMTEVTTSRVVFRLAECGSPGGSTARAMRSPAGRVWS